MAGQTDTADDLIAELARLMAEDAQTEKPKGERPAVRIPGAPEPARPDTQKNLDSPQKPDAPRADAPPPAAETRHPDAPQVRIPGMASPPSRRETGDDDQARPVARPEVRTEPPMAPIRVTAGLRPSIDVPSPEAPTKSPPEPTVNAPQAPEPPALDQDGLADLIASELAGGKAFDTPDRTPDPVPERDSFDVPPRLDLGLDEPPPEPKSVSRPDPAPPVPKAAEADEARPGEAPTPGAPDPLDEIERLIGPSVRVESKRPTPSPSVPNSSGPNSAAPTPSAPSPSLRSLATPTLPPDPAPTSPASASQTSARPTSPASLRIKSADDAILAAAKTSGAQVDWVEPVIATNFEESSARKSDMSEIAGETAAPRARDNRVLGMTRSAAGPLVALLLLGIAAVALYTVLGLGNGGSDEPVPLIVAETEPIKKMAETEEVEVTQSPVFDEIDGIETSEQEQIVSRDQADLGAVGDGAAVADFSQADADGLVNRKVRTVTVRPDGTIVSSSDSVAGATLLPVARPDVPEIPGADFPTPDLIATAAPDAPADADAAGQPDAMAPAAMTVEPGSFVPAVTPDGDLIEGKRAPVPVLKPESFSPQAIAAARQALPIATPAASPAPVAAAPTLPSSPISAASAPAYVQLSSQRSEEAARRTVLNIQSRFGGLLGDTILDVQRVDLGQRGIFYRVLAPAPSVQSANALCASIKANGGDCFIQ